MTIVVANLCPLHVAAATGMFAAYRSYQADATAEKQALQDLLHRCLSLRSQRLSSLLRQPLREAAASGGDIMTALLALRSALPAANVSRMVATHPRLLRASAEQLRSSLGQAAALLGGEGSGVDDWQALLERAPFLLQPDVLQAALEDCGSLFPGQPAGYVLQQHVMAGASAVLRPHYLRAIGEEETLDA